jgi:uncharacterized membrane protein required for colicin V production
MGAFILLIAIAIIGWSALRGLKNGLIRTAFSTCAIVIIIVASYILGPILATALSNNDTVMKGLTAGVRSTIAIDTLVKTDIVDEAIDSLPFPQIVKNAVRDSGIAGVGKQNIEGLKTGICSALALYAVKALSFTAIFIILSIVLAILVSILDIISKLPVLNALNKSGGLVIGIIRGLAFIWIACIILTVFCGTEIGKQCMDAVKGNVFLAYIYDHNPFAGTVFK